jgi:hypothetical protein
MRALVLFCGTGSIDKAFQRLGWEVVSVDWEAKYSPTHVADLMTWDYEQYPKGYFSFVWGSPACTQFSIARTTGGPRDIEGATALVARTLEIMEHFECPWALENPQTGLLKDQPLMQGLPHSDVTYCQYGFPYKKKTRIWNSLGDAWKPRPVCCRESPCPAFALEGVHPMSAQRGASKVKGQRRNGDNCSQAQLYSMPPQLCDEIAQAARDAVESRLPAQ